MVDLLVKFFLWLCLLLSGAGHQLYAGECFTSHQPNHNLTGQLTTVHDASRLVYIQEVTSLARKEKATIISVDEDDEDDHEDSESGLVKKCLAPASYFNTFFYASALPHFCNYIKECLSFRKHFSYFSSNIFIVFRVIRL